MLVESRSAISLSAYYWPDSWSFGTVPYELSTVQDCQPEFPIYTEAIRGPLFFVLRS